MLIRAFAFDPIRFSCLLDDVHVLRFDQMGESRVDFPDDEFHLHVGLGRILRLRSEAEGRLRAPDAAGLTFWRTDHCYDDDILRLVRERQAGIDPLIMHDVFLNRVRRADCTLFGFSNDKRTQLVESGRRTFDRLRWVDRVLAEGTLAYYTDAADAAPSEKM